MKKDTKKKDKHLVEIADLRLRLEETQDMLRAIRRGEVDAVVVSGPQGDQIYTLKGAEQPYRVFVENMSEGAVTLSYEGTILYCNERFTDMVETSYENAIGKSLSEFIVSTDGFESAFRRSKRGKEKLEILLKRKSKEPLPVSLSLNPLPEEGVPGICVVVTDLEVLKESEKQLKYLTSKLLTAQEDERRRVAHDIHDSLGSQLSAVKFKVEDFFKMMPSASESITSALQEAISESRRIQMDLHPSMLEDLGIAPTLTWFCRKFEKTYSLSVEQKVTTEESEIPKPLKRTIYRISQEALNNVAKHSRANQVCLSLYKNTDTIELVIQDNGHGFDVSTDAPRKGLGLSSMKERAEFSGGTLSVQSERGKGTVVRASWPCD